MVERALALLAVSSAVDPGDLSIDELIEFVWGDDFEMSPRKKHSPSPPRRERSGPHSARF